MVCPSDLRALDAPSAEARAAADNLRLDFVNESADRAAKYAKRAAKYAKRAAAARRRDRLTVHVRLRQTRLCINALVDHLESGE
jgi:hypothetical protein